MPDLRSPTDHEFESWDETKLSYRAWTPDAPSDKALLLFHRGHEHSGRLLDLVRDLDLADFHIFAWDQRGHGRSPGERGYAENVGVLAKDAEAWARHLMREHGFALENMAVLAHSVGAVVAATWVHDYAPPLRAMVLGTPAFAVKLYVPGALPALRLRHALLGRGVVKSYVKSTMLTHDPDQARVYQADPLIFREIADNLLIDLADTARRIVADAGAIHVPTLLLAAGNDWVVRGQEQWEFVQRLSSKVKRFEVLPGFYHSIFHETDRLKPIGMASAFFREQFAHAPDRHPLVDADRDGYTRREFERLSAPSSNPLWPVTRFAMKTLGRRARGIQIGWESGFDSGVMLDHVYANTPAGSDALGRFLDKQYLNSIGWRGIRQRKVHLMQRLRAALHYTHAQGRPVRLLDIAAGPGRYVLETLRSLGALPITALLRDYKEENLAAGRRLAEQWHLPNVTFARGDAFDRDGLAALTPRPTVAIVSGLYELFPDNAPVRRSLAGLADALDPGCLLLYTNQPWHPQVEFIARVLTNREGKPWVMRRRTQLEMDDLVHEAGFEKVAMDADPWGIFTVSVAVRRG